MRNYLITICCVCTALNSFGQAQKITTGRETYKADINFEESAKFDEEHPTKRAPRMPFDEDGEERPTRPMADPSKVFLYHPNAANRFSEGHAVLLPATITPVDTFLSVTSNGTEIPPDTHGAVDSGYIVTAVNPDVHLQYRNTGTIRTTALDTWFSSVLPHGPGTFDPRVHYDPYSKRWIMTALAYGETAEAELIVAMSATSNPNATWHAYAIRVDATGGDWLDFDNTGFNKNWIVVCGNWFNVSGGGSHSGAEVYVFNKDSIMAGLGAPFTGFEESTSFSLAPALVYDSSVNSLELLETWNEPAGQLHLMKITGTASAPILTTVGYPSTTVSWNSVDNGSQSDFAPQKGTTNKIQTNDDRINNLSERNGVLVTSHNVFLPYGASPNRCSVMWWEIDTTGTVMQNGLIDDPTHANFYAFPSAAINQYNDILLGYSCFNANSYPNCAYSIHMATDPADSMRPKDVFRHGQANYYQTFGGGQNRWGDYSATVIDPINNTDFWTIQECVPSSPANYWDTWWAHIQTCFVSDTISATSFAINPGTSDTINITGSNSTGAIYTWNFTGGLATPGTGSGPQVVSWDSSGYKVVSVTVTTDGGCTATYVDSIFVNNLAVPKVANPIPVVSVFPNPSNGKFDLNFTQSITKPFSIKITDVTGRVVYSESVTNVNSKRFEVTADKLLPGNYLVNVLLSNAVVTDKLVIEK